jgi:hypothetical protein
MPSIEQGPAIKGSQKWIQRLVNDNSDLLNSRIRTQLDLPDTDTITWRSPIAEDGYLPLQVAAIILWNAFSHRNPDDNAYISFHSRTSRYHFSQAWG